MEQLLAGAIAGGSFVAGLFFLRFWKRSRDRLFLCFAGAFWLEAANRVMLVLGSEAGEGEPLFYLLRLAAYALIIVAIWQKNRKRW